MGLIIVTNTLDFSVVARRACVIIKKFQKITSIKTNFSENVMNIQIDLK
jgi:hypothetical protein